MKRILVLTATMIAIAVLMTGCGTRSTSRNAPGNVANSVAASTGPSAATGDNGSSQNSLEQTTSGNIKYFNAPSDPIYQLHMFSANSGWAITQGVNGTVAGRNLWHVSGKGWAKVTLPAGTSKFRTFSAQDASTAWMTTDIKVAKNQAKVEVMRTTDGGKTWKPAGTVSIPYRWQFVTGMYVDPLSNSVAWLQLNFESAMNSQLSGLLMTTDGGKTWKNMGQKGRGGPLLHGLPKPGHKVEFLNTHDGWFADEWPTSGDVELYHTSDSGHTWNHVSLPLPKGYQKQQGPIIFPPVFSQNDGVIVAQMWSDTSGNGLGPVAIYHTSDGGSSWSLVKMLSQATGLQSTPVDFISPSTGWYLTAKGDLFETTNGGPAWQHVGKLPTHSRLDFVSPQVGWAATTGGQVMKSLDGGKTWTVIK